MVPQETHERNGGEFEGCFVGTGAPDGSRHGDQVVVAECVGVTLLVKILSNALLFSWLGDVIMIGMSGSRADRVRFAFVFAGEEVQSKLIEAYNIEDHSPHPRLEDIGSLGEYRV